MEYNKTKRTLEKIAGILGIISAALFLILTLVLIVMAFMYFFGAFDYTYIVDYDFSTGQPIFNTTSNSIVGIPVLLAGLVLATISILLLVFSVKLTKSPFLPNGEMRKMQGIRIWVLVLAILTGDLIVIGLMIAVLCLKDFKELTANQPVVGKQSVNHSFQQNEFYDFYQKIQEVKKLKSLDIIDKTAYKKAVTKIVIDLTKEKISLMWDFFIACVDFLIFYVYNISMEKRFMNLCWRM